MKPLLSVVIPNYNNSRYLKDCLYGVISQTYRPLEIIIVDDCSTDNSRYIINNFMENYSWVQGIFLEVNGGVSHARNVGVKNAHGEYITFLDSDDYYVNIKKLDLEMELLLSRQKEKVAAFSRLVAVDREGKRMWEYHTKKAFRGRMIKKAFLESKNIQLPRDFCIKKECHEKVGGFNERSSLYEDTDYLLRLSGILDFYCTGEFGSAYRITGTGLSNVSQEKHKKAVAELRMRYKDNFTTIEWIEIEIRFRIQGIYDRVKEQIKGILKKV